jgi:hypothetical protein
VFCLNRVIPDFPSNRGCGRSRDFGLDALENGRPLWHRLESGFPCLRQNSHLRDQIRGFRGRKFRNQERKTTWRWTESRANRSPPNFPANREIYREKLPDASKVSAREAVYLAELGIFIRPLGNQLLHRPGNYFRCIRELPFSLICRLVPR